MNQLRCCGILLVIVLLSLILKSEGTGRGQGIGYTGGPSGCNESGGKYGSGPSCDRPSKSDKRIGGGYNAAIYSDKVIESQLDDNDYDYILDLSKNRGGNSESGKRIGDGYNAAIYSDKVIESQLDDNDYDYILDLSKNRGGTSESGKRIADGYNEAIYPDKVVGTSQLHGGGYSFSYSKNRGGLGKKYIGGPSGSGELSMKYGSGVSGSSERGAGSSYLDRRMAGGNSGALDPSKSSGSVFSVNRDSAGTSESGKRIADGYNEAIYSDKVIRTSQLHGGGYSFSYGKNRGGLGKKYVGGPSGSGELSMKYGSGVSGSSERGAGSSYLDRRMAGGNSGALDPSKSSGSVFSVNRDSAGTSESGKRIADGYNEAIYPDKVVGTSQLHGGGYSFSYSKNRGGLGKKYVGGPSGSGELSMKYGSGVSGSSERGAGSSYLDRRMAGGNSGALDPSKSSGSVFSVNRDSAGTSESGKRIADGYNEAIYPDKVVGTSQLHGGGYSFSYSKNRGGLGKKYVGGPSGSGELSMKYGSGVSGSSERGAGSSYLDRRMAGGNSGALDPSKSSGSVFSVNRDSAGTSESGKRIADGYNEAIYSDKVIGTSQLHGGGYSFSYGKNRGGLGKKYVGGQSGSGELSMKYGSGVSGSSERGAGSSYLDRRMAGGNSGALNPSKSSGSVFSVNRDSAGTSESGKRIADGYNEAIYPDKVVGTSQLHGGGYSFSYSKNRGGLGKKYVGGPSGSGELSMKYGSGVSGSSERGAGSSYLDRRMAGGNSGALDPSKSSGSVFSVNRDSAGTSESGKRIADGYNEAIYPDKVVGTSQLHGGGYSFSYSKNRGGLGKKYVGGPSGSGELSMKYGSGVSGSSERGAGSSYLDRRMAGGNSGALDPSKSSGSVFSVNRDSAGTSESGKRIADGYNEAIYPDKVIGTSQLHGSDYNLTARGSSGSTILRDILQSNIVYGYKAYGGSGVYDSDPTKSS